MKEQIQKLMDQWAEEMNDLCELQDREWSTRKVHEARDDTITILEQHINQLGELIKE